MMLRCVTVFAMSPLPHIRTNEVTVTLVTVSQTAVAGRKQLRHSVTSCDRDSMDPPCSR